jgi:hypothetical protein
MPTMVEITCQLPGCGQTKVEQPEKSLKKLPKGAERRVCPIDGKDFVATAAQIKRGNGEYCSVSCGLKARAKPKVNLVCAYCGKDFEVEEWRTKNGRAKYCCDAHRLAAPTRVAVPVEKRFWDKVDKSGDCWLWTAATANGYGTISVDAEGTQKGAHVVSYEMVHGPVPEGLWVLHTCDIKLCVRPEHLYAGTPSNNNQDSWDRTREKALTEEQKTEIRLLYNQKPRPSQTELAVVFGVHQTTISRVLRE